MHATTHCWWRTCSQLVRGSQGGPSCIRAWRHGGAEGGSVSWRQSAGATAWDGRPCFLGAHASAPLCVLRVQRVLAQFARERLRTMGTLRFPPPLAAMPVTPHATPRAMLCRLNGGLCACVQGLGLPDHIVNPNQPMQLPPGVSIDGLSPVPTPDLCLTGMVTAARLSDDAEYKDVSGGRACAAHACVCVRGHACVCTRAHVCVCVCMHACASVIRLCCAVVGQASGWSCQRLWEAWEVLSRGWMWERSLLFAGQAACVRLSMHPPNAHGKEDREWRHAAWLPRPACASCTRTSCPALCSVQLHLWHEQLGF